ncbi:MAG: hypothetical protein PHR30_04045 [Gallionellaceae bacterium]|nr:hypothetical protein [Gallionellaceae bacterium]
MFSRIIVVVVHLAVAAQAEAGTPPFTGVWESEHCVVDHERQHCPGLTLVLVQEGQRLCGSHFAATPDFSRVDEGVPSSVVGTAIGQEAVLFVASGRDPTNYLARVSLTSNGLVWHLVERLVDGGDIGPPVIALAGTLHRSSGPKWLAKTTSACEARFKILP